MRSLCLCLLLGAVLGLTTAYWMEPGALDNSYANEADVLSQEKRSESDWRTEGTRLNRLKEMYTLGQQRARRSGRTYKRSNDGGRDLCIPWRSPCTNDEALKRKYEWLVCCDNMACKCSFWGSNCRCYARLG